jgi:hypothetical protein
MHSQKATTDLIYDDKKKEGSDSPYDTLNNVNNMIGGFFQEELSRKPTDELDEIKQYCLKLAFYRLGLYSKYEEASRDTGVFNFFLERVIVDLEEKLKKLNGYLEIYNSKKYQKPEYHEKRQSINIHYGIAKTEDLLERAKIDYFFINRLNVATPPLIKSDIELIQKSKGLMPRGMGKNYAKLLIANIPELKKHYEKLSTLDRVWIVKGLNSTESEIYFGKIIIDDIFKSVKSSDDDHFYLVNQSNGFDSQTLNNYFSNKLSDLKKDKVLSVKTKIETVLDDAIKKGINKPWPLGWAGSRHSIQYKGQTFQVPQGIATIYQLATPENHDNKNAMNLAYESIKTILNDKQWDSRQTFFRKITGSKRSDETKEEYNSLSQLIGL